MPTVPDQETSAESLWRGGGAWIALALGVFVRVAALVDKPFWRDEAWVAVLARGDIGQVLTGPQRAVPIGFLVVTKLASVLPLPPELSLRLLPLLAGLATLVVLPALARRLGASRTTQLAVLWLAAGAPALVYYARELKPYSLDALVAALAALHALPSSKPRPPAAEWRGLAALAVAPWVTFGSVFAVSAALLAAGLLLWHRRDGHEARRIAAAALVYGASLLLAWTVAIRSQAASPRIAETWAEDLADFRPATPAAVGRAGVAYVRGSLEPLFPVAAPVAAVLAVAGAIGWPRHGRGPLVILCALTAAAAVGAALLGAYPLTHGRLLQFAAPGLLLLVASGLVMAGAGLARLGLPGPHVAVVAAASYALAWSTVVITHRYQGEGGAAGSSVSDVLHDVEPMIAAAEKARAPGEPVLVSKYAGESFRYYADGRLPDALVCTRVECRSEGPVLGRWLASLQGRRGWMLLLAEEDEVQRRRTLREAGVRWREAARSRGARLWEVVAAPRQGTDGSR